MSTPNPAPVPNAQLEATLAQFANQPGVTTDQAAQLRAAVTADATQLQLLNQHAQAENLREFALPQAEHGAQSNRQLRHGQRPSDPTAIRISAQRHYSADLMATVSTSSGWRVVSRQYTPRFERPRLRA